MEYQLLITSYINMKLFAGVRNKKEEINWSAGEVCFTTKTKENPLNILPFPAPLQKKKPKQN